MASVAESMGATLQRAACSPNIKERLDFSCAVFDRRGRLLAQAAHIPVHLGALPASVAAARRYRARWARGDLVVLNDPYQGGSHLPDITTVSPVFGPSGRSPLLFLATRAHHADVGGAAPGSLPNALDLLGEGLVIPPVRLKRAGRLDGDILALLCANSRSPEERRGDLEAQLAAHHAGTERLEAMARTDALGIAAEGDALIAHARRMAGAALGLLPPGVYRFEDHLEDDGQGSGPLPLVLTLEVADGRLLADFAGTAPQARGGVNAPFAVTQSAVYYVAACLAGETPVNAGLFDAVTVRAPEGCLLNPRPPAAVAAGNVETSQRVVDLLLGALAQALPDRIPAASQGTMNNLAIGGEDPRGGRPFTYYETLGGGGGAGPDGPGASGLQVHMTNTRNTPVEALETSYPLRVEAYRLRRGSGGAGRWPGGEGIERRIRFLAPAVVSLMTERRLGGPWGLAGGAPGAPGENRLLRAGAASDQGAEEALPAKRSFPVEAGDALIIRSPGGGGWGRPEADQEGRSGIR